MQHSYAETVGSTTGSAAKMKKKKTAAAPSVDAWVKNHPLEGDNVITGFYSFLQKRNVKTMKPCRGVLVPDTIVFEHSFPRGWYTTDIKSGEVGKKQGKDLDTATILRHFSEPPAPDVHVVASYISVRDSAEGDGDADGASVEVEVFNEDAIAEFLARKEKRDGVLQRFVVSKGYKNTVIQAVWTPRVCIMQRRTNVHNIRDSSRSDVDPYSVSVTYEGPEYLSEMGTVSGNVTAEVKRICGHIVSHFYLTEHKFITRMVLYFKVDHRDRIWFLWCSCLRVSDRNGSNHLPITLSTTFTTPVNDMSTAENEEKMLFNADRQYVKLTQDELFAEQYFKRGHGYPILLQKALQQQSEEEAQELPVAQPQADAIDAVGVKAAGGTGTANYIPDGVSKAVAARIRQQQKEAELRSQEEAEDAVWLLAHPDSVPKYDALCNRRQAVLLAIEDVFYQAYNTVLENQGSTFSSTLSQKVVEACGGAKSLHAVMQGSGIDTMDSEDGGVVCSFPKRSTMPLSRLRDRIEAQVMEYYVKEIDHLKSTDS